jgi:hypothetical protein
VITTAVTAAVTALLALFGIEPSGYLIGGIAVVVKGSLIVGGILLARKVARRRKAEAAANPPKEPGAGAPAP